MTIWLKLGIFLAAMTIPAVLREAGYAADAAHPTVVELFQSQGCSDCPPAATNVAAISDLPDVLALSFAVDYWDRLGWKDTFSKPAWTARQYAMPMRRDVTTSIRLRSSSTAVSRATVLSRGRSRGS